MAIPSLRDLDHLYDKLTTVFGSLVAWLVFLMAFITGVVVVLRYVIGDGSIGLQESINYVHSALFMLGASYALHKQAHVRVDVLYTRYSPLTKAWVNCIGHLVFLLPVSVFIVWVSLDYVGASWQIQEISADAGGLTSIYLLKTLMPIMGGLLIIAGLVELARDIATLLYELGRPENG